MRLAAEAIEPVGDPERAGVPRTRHAIRLVVVLDTSGGAAPSNYTIDQAGRIRQLVADSRAGAALGLAIHAGRRRNLDQISLSVGLERGAAGYSDRQVAALHRLLPDLLARHQLDWTALVTILPDAAGRARVCPYLPPPTSVEVVGVPLSAARDLAQELFVFLFGESYRPRGGTLRLSQAFPLHAAQRNLGAPVGRNEPPPLLVDGRRFNFQPFARDTLFNEGTDYAAVQQLSALFDAESLEIPATGLGRSLLEASYRAALAVSKSQGRLSGNEQLRPDWRFHQVAKNAGFGPPLSGNYRSDDGAYAVQVFAGETLYTPVSELSGCRYLSATEPDDPAYATIWRETYKVAGVAYDPASPFQQQAAALKLGAPLSGVYTASHNGTSYRIQVWALDTLYAGPDGQIRRMSDLPKPPEVQAWQPQPPKPLPPTPPNPLPPTVAVISVGPPRPGDINWPPRPDFPMLTDRNGERERLLGHIAWVRASGDLVTITNGWDREHLVDVYIPQLARIRGGNGGRLRFHRIAAAQLQRLFAAWEAAGLLQLIKTFDGAWLARTIRLKPTVLSNHAYGTAFDINAAWNGLMRVAALVGQPGSVRELVPLANAHGFYWGGHWNFDGKGASDGMHFEWAVARQGTG